MSEGQTNPQAEVAQPEPQLNMFDVMFGSEESTNPEQASEPSQVQQEEVVEEAPIEAQAEEEVEADVPEEVEEQYEVEEAEVVQETKEVDPVYRVKVDGEEFEVSLDELRDGYQRQSDYTRKSQSLAEQRKTYEANLQAVQSERQQYSKVLDNISQYQNLEINKLNNIDWASLKEADPMEYMEKRMEFQDAKDKLQQVNVEQQRVQQQQQHEYAEHLQKHVETEAEKLVQALPEYADPAVKTQLREYAMKDLGFSKEDVDGITDHRVVMVLYKSMLQDKATKGTSKAKKKNVPKVVKSGTPESKKQKSRKALTAKRDRLKKTGHVRDGAKVFLDFV